MLQPIETPTFDPAELDIIRTLVGQFDLSTDDGMPKAYELTEIEAFDRVCDKLNI